MKMVRRMALAAALLAPASLASAATATVKGDPSVSVDVPAGFESSETDHGIQVNTPDEEVMVWFETYDQNTQDTMVKEHDAYWKDQGVKLGEAERTTQDSDGRKIIASAYKNATWKGKPTIVRYLFIDPGAPSKEMILMSLWASPEGFAAHNADVTKIVNSIDLK